MGLSPVLGQNIFHDGRKAPKNIVALHVQKQNRRNEVHRLAVAQHLQQSPSTPTR
jgi:hypothetical protein